jgi:RNA 2',3'-cyclic 3'-phosphodiesterase
MRIFIAIALPAYIRQTLCSLQGGVQGARWVDGDNLHLTLCFVGEADDLQVRDLDSELSTIAAPAFEAAISGLGTFERRKRVHMLWAGIEASPALNDLHERVEAAVLRAGFQAEKRKFKAHVTLARFRQGAGPDIGQYLEASNIYASGVFPVEEFSVYRSHLNSDGARYEIVSTYDLVETVG